MFRYKNGFSEFDLVSLGKSGVFPQWNGSLIEFKESDKWLNHEYWVNLKVFSVVCVFLVLRKHAGLLQQTAGSNTVISKTKILQRFYIIEFSVIGFKFTDSVDSTESREN